ncbi:MAG: ATP synthase F1 subunit delta [Eubacterium sp.]|nr:ATP synthase F1 subunit delta [Eubacterium sp.]
MAKLVSKVYGDALFSLALEENRVDEIWEETKVLRQVMVENPDFIPLLCNPNMTEAKRSEILEEIFQGKISDASMGFLEVLVKKGRLEEIVSVLDYFDDCTKEYKKIGVVYVSTPKALSKDQKKKVEDRILEVSDYETLETHYSLEPDLLGGMVIRIGDRVLDNSIRSKMDLMTRKLSQVKLSN